MIEYKKCIVCKKLFEVNDKICSFPTNKMRRRNNCVTCSKKCSRIYLRIYTIIKNKIIRKLKEKND